MNRLAISVLKLLLLFCAFAVINLIYDMKESAEIYKVTYIGEDVVLERITK